MKHPLRTLVTATALLLAAAACDKVKPPQPHVDGAKPAQPAPATRQPDAAASGLRSSTP